MSGFVVLCCDERLGPEGFRKKRIVLTSQVYVMVDTKRPYMGSVKVKIDLD